MNSIIVAIAQNNAIGKDNKLLCHIPEDLKWFKKLTTGHTIIMGKRTYESLPLKPLPNRRSIVITDDPLDCFEGCLMVTSILDALKCCNPDEENFIIGGASIYKQFMPLTDRLYVTRIHADFEGDVFFPDFSLNEWKLISSENQRIDSLNGFPYSFQIYEKIR
ncbi:MAG: dihydrofolate reductase [Bacteroidetes bacterium]|nr:dihydrofolate reductase [Bacteroidota bacterium]